MMHIFPKIYIEVGHAYELIEGISSDTFTINHINDDTSFNCLPYPGNKGVANDE